MKCKAGFKDKRIFNRLILGLTIFLLSCSVQEQPEKATDAPLPPTWRSYQKAQAILDAGLQALGGAEKIRAIENISIVYDGLRHMINQSRAAAGPWDKEPSTGKIIIDRKNNRMYNLSSSSYKKFYGKRICFLSRTPALR